MLRRFKQIIPEIVFQRIYDCLEEKLELAFEILRNVPANPAHGAISALYEKLDVQVLTTNLGLS